MLNYQNNKELIPITLITKDYGKSAKAFKKQKYQIEFNIKLNLVLLTFH